MSEPNQQTENRYHLWLLFLLFLGLKLTGYISWSWWWVTAPLWVIPVLVMLLAIVALFIGAIVAMWPSK